MKYDDDHIYSMMLLIYITNFVFWFLKPKQVTWSLPPRRLCARNRSKVLLYFLCTLILRLFMTASYVWEKKNYVGEIVRHLATRVNEHLITDRALHNHKHLERNESCSKLCSKHCFQVLDSAATEFELRIKEAIHIRRKNPSLNTQVKHINLKFSL